MGKAEATADGPVKGMLMPEDTTVHGNHNFLHHTRLFHREPPLRRPREEHPVIVVQILFRHPARRMLGCMRDLAGVGEAEAAAGGPEKVTLVDWLLVSVILSKDSDHLMDKNSRAGLVSGRQDPHRCGDWGEGITVTSSVSEPTSVSVVSVYDASSHVAAAWRICKVVITN